MKIRNLNDLSESLFHSLKLWAESSPANWNLLIGVGFITLVLGLILWGYFCMKIGKEDEYTKNIYYKAFSAMLVIIVLCDIIFPKEYMWQIFFLFKYDLAFLVSSFVIAIQYKKDFM